MAHKTIVDGTEYAITGGKCMVDGTVYEIKNGKTLIAGTVYSIEFSAGTVKVTLDFNNECGWSADDSNNNQYSRFTINETTYNGGSEDAVLEVLRGTQIKFELRVPIDDHWVYLYLNNEELYKGIPKTDSDNKDETGHEATKVFYTFEVNGPAQIYFRVYVPDASSGIPYQEIKITGDATLVSHINPNENQA